LIAEPKPGCGRGNTASQLLPQCCQRIRASAGHWQRHRQRAPLRRIAHAKIGAALVADFKLEIARLRFGVAGKMGGQCLAIGLHLAEKLIHMTLAVRQLQRFCTVAIQVIPVRNLPVEFNPVAV